MSLPTMPSHGRFCRFIPVPLRSTLTVVVVVVGYVLFLFPAALMGLLAVLDFMFVNHACHSIITRGASVQLVFGFEVGHVSLGASAVQHSSVPGHAAQLRTGLQPGVVIAGRPLRREEMSEPAARVSLPVRHPAHHGPDHLHQVPPAHHRPAE